MNSTSIVSRIRTACALVLISAASAGCYLLESAHGQLELMSKREPISRVIADPRTPPAVRSQLKSVAEIRDFATHELGLPDNGSYRSYADVGRAYVVWNVVATPEFSVEPKEWCYPIVGCVAYRGYFVEKRARKFGENLERRGLDVSIDGVAAYSTLGHFDDPVLNTMLGWNDVELAAIIFHELTHQLIYIPNDADFNEALATTVEEEGVRRWLLSLGRAQELAEFTQEEERYVVVVAMLNHARDELRSLYASGAEVEVMRTRKAAVFTSLRDSYETQKAQWGGHAPFSAWFEQRLDNANLASVATYFDCVPGFKRELAAVDGNLEVFYARVREFARWDQERRDALLCGSRSSH